MNRSGKVFVQNRFAGVIAETDDGYQFTYDKEYYSDPAALPVSLTLPLSQDTYNLNILFPFFDGLIPEGWLLNVVEHNWKIDGNDRFGLLLVTCRDCIGDVFVEAES